MVSGEVLIYERITGYCPFSLNKKITRDRQSLILIRKKTLRGVMEIRRSSSIVWAFLAGQIKRKNYKTQYTP
jgi:hypothetical protein